MKTKTPPLNVSPRISLRFALALVGAALIACCPLQTRADTIALSFTESGAPGSVFTASGTFGWAFTLSSPVLVTNLGLWDFNNDGLNASHDVTIWTSTGTQEAQATIPSGTGATLTDGFRYEPIAPVLLPAGSYTIGGFYSPEGIADEASSIATASGVTYDGGRSGMGFAFPPGDFFGVPNGDFGPNFQFEGVPEPSTWAVGLLTAGALLCSIWRRRVKPC